MVALGGVLPATLGVGVRGASGGTLAEGTVAFAPVFYLCCLICGPLTEPPVATTTPGGAERTSVLDDVVFVVDVGVPVDVSTVVPVASGAGTALSEFAAGCVDAESVADESTPDDVDPGGSAHHPHLP